MVNTFVPDTETSTEKTAQNLPAGSSVSFTLSPEAEQALRGVFTFDSPVALLRLIEDALRSYAIVADLHRSGHVIMAHPAKGEARKVVFPFSSAPEGKALSVFEGVEENEK